MRVIYWSDFNAMLHLICNNTHGFCVFVDSRLAEIRESSLIHNWRYCPTNLNPSDVGTRLITPKNRKKILPWVEGPEFLLSLNCEWPSLPIIGDEVNKTKTSFISIDNIKVEHEGNLNCLFEKFVAFVNYYSDFHRLIHSLCYVFRVIKACLMKDNEEKKNFLQLSVLPLTA